MLPGGLRVLLAVAPIDMRRSIDGLAAYLSLTLHHDPRAERAFFVFTNKKRDRAKVLWRDATGWCLLYKRLDKLVIALPTSIPAGAATLVMDPRGLARLLDGVARAPRETARDIARRAKAKARALISTPSSPGLR